MALRWDGRFPCPDPRQIPLEGETCPIPARAIAAAAGAATAHRITNMRSTPIRSPTCSATCRRGASSPSSSTWSCWRYRWRWRSCSSPCSALLTLGLGWALFWLVSPASIIWAIVYYGATLGGPHSATVGMRVMDLELRTWYGAPGYFVLGAAHAVLFWISISVLSPLILLIGLFNARRRLAARLRARNRGYKQLHSFAGRPACAHVLNAPARLSSFPAHDLRANASRLSRGKTGAHFFRIMRGVL